MKPVSIRIGIALLGAAALLLPSNQVRGQGAPPPSDYTNTFDTSTSTASWIYWYGLGFNNTPLTFDMTMDAHSDANSGSLQVSLPFSTNGDQAVWFGTFHNGYGYDGTTIYDGTKFTNITFDVHVDPSSPLSPAGDFGQFSKSGWFDKAGRMGELSMPIARRFPLVPPMVGYI